MSKDKRDLIWLLNIALYSDGEYFTQQQTKRLRSIERRLKRDREKER